MKTFALIPALVVISAFVAAIPASASTVYINLQDDNGETRVSMSWSSDITGAGITAPYIDWLGIGGFFPGSMNGGGSSNYVSGVGSFVGYVEPLSGFGTFKDLTTGSTATVNTFLAIPDFLNSGSVVNIRFANSLANSSSDIIQYIPATDSATLAIPFSSFNPGTYNVSPGQPINEVVTVEPIPEPASVLIATLGWLGLLVFRRRMRPFASSAVKNSCRFVFIRGQTAPTESTRFPILCPPAAADPRFQRRCSCRPTWF